MRTGKPFEFGDNLSNLTCTKRCAICHRPAGQGHSDPAGQDDFVVYETEYQTSCATVVLIDMSAR